MSRPEIRLDCLAVIVLADLGVSGEDKRIHDSIEHFLELHSVESGGFSLRPKGTEGFNPHVCATGNMVRTLAKFGYDRDERVVKAMEGLVSAELFSKLLNVQLRGPYLTVG